MLTGSDAGNVPSRCPCPAYREFPCQLFVPVLDQRCVLAERSRLWNKYPTLERPNLRNRSRIPRLPDVPSERRAMRTNWQLKIHEKNAISSPPISTFEFDDLSSLRASLAANRQRSFVIAPPSHATQNDFLSLLDLRSQGFDINRQN